jgi:hypothetical protein
MDYYLRVHTCAFCMTSKRFMTGSAGGPAAGASSAPGSAAREAGAPPT